MSRKRITDRLSFKVFLITFIVQVMFGVLIYAFLYRATPLTWNMVRRTELETAFEKFAKELGTVKFRECGQMVDEFILANECHIVFYKGEHDDPNRLPVSVPGSEYALRTRWDVKQLTGPDSDAEMNFMISEHVYFAQEIKNEYTVVCLWSQRGENVLWQALQKTLPLIVAAIVLVSLLCSFIYTLLFARPVQKLSAVSGKIAKMDFTAKSRLKRRDEIGDLGRDLDMLSSNLDETITKLNNRTEELEREMERTSELEKQKDVFFAAASHELKTPITIAQGQVRGMMDGIEPYNDLETYLPKTLSNLKRMESLINEILTASRMQAGNEIALQTEDFGLILKKRIEEISDLLDVRGIALETAIDDGLFFEGNKDLTSMAVGSFLSNAVFYSSEGSKVTVTSGTSDGKIVTKIRNTDSHIDEKDLPHLFEAFYRTDNSRSRRNGGSGLGLYLGKLIIERQNGTVALENDGQDVVASIILPLSTKNT
ncbi:sensor histidine kinase [Butyrivibrio sp. AE2032]|uniref:sensor histidine kinase n=1 Tax=Butyrivibrio sp. AE2032 TaxID=1458463 RepID=UPI0006899A76|nr:HAMP domain-containing sensor histidine kinase [Butyrivibrio sp. AE2032]